MLVNHFGTPFPQCVHEMHIVFGFGSEPCDGLAFDDRLTRLQIDDICEYRWSMAYSADYSSIGPDLRCNCLEAFRRWIIDQSRMTGGGEEDSILPAHH